MATTARRDWPLHTVSFAFAVLSVLAPPARGAVSAPGAPTGSPAATQAPPAGSADTTAAPAEGAEDGDSAASGIDTEPTETFRDALTVTDKATSKAKVDTDVRSLPASSVVLNALKTWREPAEALRAIPGVDFVYYGQGGVPSGPSLRGYTNRNFGQDIAAFIDGVPLNVPGFVSSHGFNDMTMLMPEVVERVDAIRGPFDARYGDFHRGAAAEFVTRPGIVAPTVALSYGSWNTPRAVVSYGNLDPGARPFSVYVNLDVKQTDGWADSQEIDHVRSYSKLRWDRDNGELSLALATFDSDWLAPGYLKLSDLQSGARDEDEAVDPTDGGDHDWRLVYLTYRHRPDTLDSLAATVYGSTKEWNRWRSDIFPGFRSNQLHQHDDRTTYGARLEKSFALSLANRPLLLLTGANAQRDDAETDEQNTAKRVATGAVSDIDEDLLQAGAFVQGQWQVASRAKLLAGVRYNAVDYELVNRRATPARYVHSYDDSRFNPQVGVAVEATRALELYANYGTGVRSPTPRSEVFNSVNTLGRVEISLTENYELGLTGRLGSSLQVQASAWRADNSNEIRAIPGTSEVESLGKSRREGEELQVTWFPGGDTRLFGAFSWIDAELLTPPAANPHLTHLEDIPDYVHQVGFETRFVPPRLAGILTLTTDFTFYGPRNLNTAGAVRTEKYERATARLMFSTDRYDLWTGGFYYPGSLIGESTYRFGAASPAILTPVNIGVRAVPRYNLEAGFTVRF